MDCPDCGGATRVIETVSYTDRVRRRRECEACGHRWTTDETARPGARTLRPGDRVRNVVSGDVGTVRKPATLQAGPGVSESNPLYVVEFDRLGEMRDVSAKLTADRLELVERAAGEKGGDR